MRRRAVFSRISFAAWVLFLLFSPLFLSPVQAICRQETGRGRIPLHRFQRKEDASGQTRASNHLAQATTYAYPAEVVKACMEDGSVLVEGKKIAFLTFDDGVYPASTPRNLDTLKEKEAPATFFVRGDSLTETNRPILERLLQEGHALAAHSFDHDYKKLYPEKKGDGDAILRQYFQSQEALDALFDGRIQMHLWRYPAGHASWTGLAYGDLLLKKQGVSWIEWNSESDDSNRHAPDTVQGQIEHIFQYAARATNPNCLVILMHDSYKVPLTIEALPDIIDALRAAGYEFGVLE